jgi:hypothetical protein
MKDILIQALAPVAGTVISALASLVLLELKKLIAARTHNEKINAAMDRISDTVETTVDQITQTVAANLKARSESGKLTRDQGKVLKQDAVAAVMKQLPLETKLAAELAVTSVTGLVGQKIEQAVLKQKAALPEPLRTALNTSEGS